MPANGPLPDVLASSLAQIVGHVSRDFERDCEVRLSAIQVELTALRADKAEFKLELDRFARDMERRVCERLAELKDGESVTLDDVLPVIAAEITRQIESSPKPLNTDEIVSLAEAAAGAAIDRCVSDIAQRAADLAWAGLPNVSALVAEHLAGATEAIAGRAAELVVPPEPLVLPDIQEMVDTTISARLSALPQEERAPTLSAEAIATLFADEMAKASSSHDALTREGVVAIVAEAVAPLVGNPEPLPDVHAIVDNAVAAAFATVAVPTNGRDADPEVTAELVREEVSRTAVAIEAAFTPADANTVSTMVAEEVKRAFDEMPPRPTDPEVRSIVATAATDLLAVPSHLLGLVERASEMLQQPFALSVDAALLTPPPRREIRKLIRTRREADGSLSAEVIEQPMDPITPLEADPSPEGPVVVE